MKEKTQKKIRKVLNDENESESGEEVDLFNELDKETTNDDDSGTENEF